MSIQSEPPQLIPPQTPTGTYCPSDVLVFTCIGVAIPLILEWQINNSLVARYAYAYGDVFPKNVPVISNLGDTTVTILDAAPVTHSHTLHNITSTLTARAMDLRNSLIRCDSHNHVGVPYSLKIREAPGTAHLTWCSLGMYNGQIKVSFQFSNFSSNNYTVNRLSASLITSQLWISNERGNPWDYFNWTDLTEGSSFILNVTAFNCDSQQGPLHSIYVQTAKKLSSLFDTEAFELENFNQQIISLNWRKTELLKSYFSHRIEEGSTFLPDIIDVTARESGTGTIIMNQRFLQNADLLCEDDQQCSIVFYASSTQELNVTVSAISSTNIQQCNIPANVYTEYIPPFSMRPFNISIISNNNSVSLYCTSTSLLVNCSIQFTISHHHDNLSDLVSISNDIPLVLAAINNTVYNFKIIVRISPTLSIVVRRTHLHRLHQEHTEEILEAVNTNAAAPNNIEGKLVLETHYFGLLVSIVAVLAILLIIAVLSVVLLLCKVKFLKKECGTNNRMELRPAIVSQVPAAPTDEAVYEELSARRSLYMEVPNEAYKRYQLHSFDKIKYMNTAQDTGPECERPT